MHALSGIALSMGMCVQAASVFGMRVSECDAEAGLQMAGLFSEPGANKDASMLIKGRILNPLDDAHFCGRALMASTSSILSSMHLLRPRLLAVDPSCPPRQGKCEHVQHRKA
jgi:hypothetical protein